MHRSYKYLVSTDDGSIRTRTTGPLREDKWGGTIVIQSPTCMDPEEYVFDFREKAFKKRPASYHAQRAQEAQARAQTRRTELEEAVAQFQAIEDEGLKAVLIAVLKLNPQDLLSALESTEQKSGDVAESPA